MIATARASSTAGTRVPLLTLTVAVALVVFCGTTAVTVQRGQLAAADIVVGAPVRIDGEIPPEALDALRDEPGVTAVAGALALGDADVRQGERRQGAAASWSTRRTSPPC